MAIKPNPMIAAVLKEIPGAESSRAQRVTWLRMIAMAMDTVYGAPEGAIDVPDFLGPLVAAPVASVAAALPAAAAEAAAVKPRAPGVVRVAPIPRYYIDQQGVARRNFRTGEDGKVQILEQGEPLFAHELGGETIYDDRGEHGDLGSILWADGSRGVLGKRISISATPEKKTA